jgi:hypothetical protein
MRNWYFESLVSDYEQDFELDENEPHGDVTKRFIRKVLEAIQEHEAESRIEANTLDKLKRFIKSTSAIRKWAVHAYRKRIVVGKH